VPPASSSGFADGADFTPARRAATVLEEAGGATFGAGCSITAALGLVRLCSGEASAKVVAEELQAVLRWILADEHDPSRWSIMAIRDQAQFDASAPEAMRLGSGPARVIDWDRSPVLLLRGRILTCSSSTAVLRAGGLVPSPSTEAMPGAGAGESKSADDLDSTDRHSVPPGAVRLRFLPGESEGWSSLPPSIRSVAEKLE